MIYASDKITSDQTTPNLDETYPKANTKGILEKICIAINRKIIQDYYF
jgi:hypothetical protein